MQHAFDNPEAIKQFVLAGNATITLQSQLSNKHYTFKIVKKKHRVYKDEFIWFVSLNIGQEYLYKCFFGPNNLVHHPKGMEDVVIRSFRYFWYNILDNKMPANMNIYHEGSCGRCGRTLTNPDSIQLGIGPECAGKV